MEDSIPSKGPSKLAQLEENYKKSIPEKLSSLQKHIDEMRLSIREETLVNLRMEVHKIAGTAGTFGFPKVSVICKEFEKVLIQMIQEYPDSHGKTEWIADLENYFNKIKDNFHS